MVFSVKKIYFCTNLFTCFKPWEIFNDSRGNYLFNNLFNLLHKPIIPVYKTKNYPFRVD